MRASIEDEGAILVEGAKQAGATGATWQPYNQGVFRDIVLWLEEDIMDTLVLEKVNVQITYWNNFIKYRSRTCGCS